MVFNDLGILNDSSLESLIVSSHRQKSHRLHLRSSLMVSAANEKHLNKLGTLPCDLAVVNLEDGVHESQKERAALMAAVFVSNMTHSSHAVSIRINPLGTAPREVELVNACLPDAVRIPKVNSAAEVEQALKLFHPSIDIHLSIETAQALACLKELKLDARVKVVFLGLLDLLESLGLAHSLIKLGNTTIEYILAKFLVESKTAGFVPFSFVYQNHKELKEFRHWCEKEYEMGFGAKACISPEQVKIVHEIFNVGSDEVTLARYVKERFEAMSAQGVSGFADEKLGFIDEPIYKNALSVLGRHIL